MYMHILLILCASSFCWSEESDKSLFPQLPVAPVTSKNELCRADSVTYLQSLDNITLWSYQMWDATEKSTTGSLQGNRFHMGNWDGCMKVKAPFKTRFCLVVVKVNIHDVEPLEDPFSLDRDPEGSVLMRMLNTHDVSQMPRDTVRIGWCVPASCTNEDLNDVLDDHFNRSKTLLMQHNVTYSGMVVEQLCETQGETKPFDGLDIIFCTILAAFLLIVMIATIYESKIEKLTEKEKLEYKAKSRRHRILIGFSARKNFVDMTRTGVSNPALSSLYGLRTVSMFVIILGHRIVLHCAGPLLNYDDIEAMYRTTAAVMIFQAVLFVDTFFIISAILVTYGLMTQLKKKYIGPMYIILARYMRLTPVYAFVILYYVTVFNYIGNGPLWKAIVREQSENCKNNWWANLLYINNYVNVEHMCIIPTWYLDCDYHYYIIAVFVILLFRKKKILGCLTFLLCFVLSIAVPFIITVIYMRPGIPRLFPDMITNPLLHADFVMIYVKSHTKGTPYCIGMMTGYVYYKMKYNKKQLSKVISHSITIVSILLLFAGVISSLPFYNPYHEYNLLEAGVYAGFHKLAWSLGTIGLLLTASFGHATIIQRALSWSAFVPLSKLVYGAYLIHMSFQLRSAGMTWTPQRLDIVTLGCLALGDCFVSFIVALVLYLSIEVPVMKLFKEIVMTPRPATLPAEANSVQANTNKSEHIQKEST